MKEYIGESMRDTRQALSSRQRLLGRRRLARGDEPGLAAFEARPHELLLAPVLLPVFRILDPRLDVGLPPAKRRGIGGGVRDREKRENTTLQALSLQEQTPQIWLSFTANRQATHLSCRCFFSSSWLATRSCQALDFLAFSLASCLGIGCAVGSA